MARPVKCRRVCEEPEYTGLVPDGIISGEIVELSVDEYETIRLVDLEKMTHVQCADQMCISKTTVTEIYESAREKLADCLANGKRLRITGGHYRVCDSLDRCSKKQCCRQNSDISVEYIGEKGENTMRIAITYENGEIFQHFGKSEQFKVYDVEEGKVVKDQVVDTNGQGHGALSGFLKGQDVDVVICGGIGAGAQNALADAGIELFGGVSGSADQAVASYLAGNLEKNAVACSHHAHGEGHSCGEHKHGCGGH